MNMMSFWYCLTALFSPASLLSDQIRVVMTQQLAVAPFSHDTRQTRIYYPPFVSLGANSRVALRPDSLMTNAALSVLRPVRNQPHRSTDSFLNTSYLSQDQHHLCDFVPVHWLGT